MFIRGRIEVKNTCNPFFHTEEHDRVFQCTYERNLVFDENIKLHCLFIFQK